MESIKSESQFLEADPRHNLSPSLTLPRLYEIVESTCQLHSGVPEEIHSYFNTVLTLYLYGWLYYPFYAFASEHSAFAIEMALRKKFPPDKLDRKGCDPRRFPGLLKHAKSLGFFAEEGFPNLVSRWAKAAELFAQIDEIIGEEPLPQEPTDVNTLIETLPSMRNLFAHPRIRSVLQPNAALDDLILAAEVISQLWPKPAE